jgi:hypothetical protein
VTEDRLPLPRELDPVAAELEGNDRPWPVGPQRAMTVGDAAAADCAKT